MYCASKATFGLVETLRYDQAATPFWQTSFVADLADLGAFKATLILDRITTHDAAADTWRPRVFNHISTDFRDERSLQPNDVTNNRENVLEVLDHVAEKF